MHYVLTGVTHDLGFRVFAFDGVRSDRLRSRYQVRVDLAMVRRYGILIQELPLLCRHLLEHQPETAEAPHLLTCTEADMCDHVNEATREAASKKKK